jgi:hypothetical protein
VGEEVLTGETGCEEEEGVVVNESCGWLMRLLRAGDEFEMVDDIGVVIAELDVLMEGKVRG